MKTIQTIYPVINDIAVMLRKHGIAISALHDQTERRIVFIVLGQELEDTFRIYVQKFDENAKFIQDPKIFNVSIYRGEEHICQKHVELNSYGNFIDFYNMQRSWWLDRKMEELKQLLPKL